MVSRPRGRNPERDPDGGDRTSDLRGETEEWVDSLKPGHVSEADRATRVERVRRMADEPGTDLQTVSTVGDDRAEQVRVLLQEWLQAHDAFLNELLIRRAAEYGSGDLEVMASAMELVAPQNGLDLEARRAFCREMSLAFYLLGKVGRMFSAYQHGRVPSTDQWRDAEAYAKMAQKVRDTGLWV